MAPRISNPSIVRVPVARARPLRRVLLLTFRLAGLLVLVAVSLLWLWRDTLNAATPCVPFTSWAVTVTNPFSPSRTQPLEREKTRRHEAVHRAQIQRLGCASSRRLRQTVAGELQIEGEAQCAEIVYELQQGTATERTAIRDAADDLIRSYPRLRPLGRDSVDAYLAGACASAMRGQARTLNPERYTRPAERP